MLVVPSAMLSVVNPVKKRQFVSFYLPSINSKEALEFFIMIRAYDIILLGETMNNKIKNVLTKLEENGFQAYVIGGFVRDFLLGIASYDVDIATNARPNDIKEIFELNNSNEDNYGSVRFKDSLYNYDITTFRKELRYENRRPVDYAFIDNASEDVRRRDFTINSLYMDANGDIFDIVGGKKDLEDKIIRTNGNINDRMVEDPLRMLRAIRFASVLGFTIEDNLYNYIRQNKQLLRTLSYSRKKDELELIFKGQNKMAGIELIKSLNIEDALDIKIPDKLLYSSNALGIWAQIEVGDKYQFSNAEKDKIENIRKVLNYGIIDNVVLYECGLYVCIIAGEMLGMTTSYISTLYKELPIYSPKDIGIDGNDIIDILHIKPGEKIKNIIFDLEINILNGKLKNEYEELKKYILENWR